MAVVLNGMTNNITVNGVSVATDTEVSSAVAPKANTADLKEIGVGQTWQNVGANRSIGVTYTNTTGKPIMVYIEAAGTDAGIFVNINGVRNMGSDISNVAAGTMSICVIVPNGNTYIAAMSGGNYAAWLELR